MVSDTGAHFLCDSDLDVLAISPRILKVVIAGVQAFIVMLQRLRSLRVMADYERIDEINETKNLCGVYFYAARGVLHSFVGVSRPALHKAGSKLCEYGSWDNTGDGAPVSPLVSNLGGNQGQGIYQFTDGNGESRVAVSLYTSGGASDVINIYNPDASSNWAEASAWTAPAEVTTSLLNIRRIVSSGPYLYGISYDNYSVNRMAASGDRYAEDKTDSYTEAGKDTHGEALVAYNRNLYAIFSVASGNVWTNGTYLANKLVKFDEETKPCADCRDEGKEPRRRRGGSIHAFRQ